MGTLEIVHRQGKAGMANWWNEYTSVTCTFFGASSRSFLHMRDSADQTLFGGVVKGVTEQDRLVSLKSRYFEVQM